jgi:peptide/nickel transport system ATP-binding protein/oligopeptide transport system ATP-binding protein
MTTPLLQVTNLKKHFPITAGILARTVGQVRAVDDISFELGRNEVLGLVGESGCGKSTAARCVLRLIEPTSGSVLFDGQDVLHTRGAELKGLRRRMQVIFQDPLSSLNPRMSVESIISEPLAIHHLYPGAQRIQRVQELLDKVGLPKSALSRYPHEFSGGQCQRIGVARALALNPELIVADEPVSALDVSVQAQIINLLVELKEQMGLSYLFIAHDLSVVRHISDRIAVMYLGHIVEMGPAHEVCMRPLHPYTQALLSVVPTPVIKKRERTILRGEIPSPANPPSGCVFHTRCPRARPQCAVDIPQLVQMRPDHQASCPYALEDSSAAAVVQSPAAAQ